MLSNSSKYAIKAVLFIAVNSKRGKKVMVKDIANPINVPKPYIAKLLQKLVKEKIISSTRGPRGGFYLNNENFKVSIMKIIHAIDGEKTLKSCMLSLDTCNEEKPCPLHNILSISRDNILKHLNQKTIEDLSNDINLGQSFLPL
ncbi:Rrf2 family transcriptional regulator [Litoribaculum gwangyangense]|uniref:RrF2 family transcriptional regulator n=1 Tax=Litoribaculum gwangyangense TaxID=1130722 RepID=A0ABP9BUJ2_9FLAO